MSERYQAPVAVLGRLLLAAIFLVSPLANLIPNFGATADAMREAGMPLPSILLALAIIVLIVGALALISGYRARWGAALLLAFLIPATSYFHAPWNASDAAEASQQIIHFLKNLALMGAMLLVIVTGPGPGSVERTR